MQPIASQTRQLTSSETGRRSESENRRRHFLVFVGSVEQTQQVIQPGAVV